VKLDLLVDQLIRHEGLRLHAYYDTVDKITVGVGRNLSDKGLTNEEAMYLLDHDIDECIADLTASYPWFAPLDDVRQRVMVDMRFNLGPTRFRGFKRMLRMMELKDYVQVAASMRQSLWYRQVKARGVRLVQMMLTGKDV
jgi:lysozyme